MKVTQEGSKVKSDRLIAGVMGTIAVLTVLISTYVGF